MLRALICLILCLPAFVAAQAAKFSDRPVRLVVPFLTWRRLVAPRACWPMVIHRLGVQVVVDNHPAPAAPSPPKRWPGIGCAGRHHPVRRHQHADGGQSVFVQKAALRRAGRFHAPGAVAVVPYAGGRAQPGSEQSRPVGQAGESQPGKPAMPPAPPPARWPGERIKRATSTKCVAVKSNPPALTDVMSGRVSMIFTDIVSVVRARSGAPQWPSCSAPPCCPRCRPWMSSVSGMEIYGWSAVDAPVKTPAPVVASKAEELRKIWRGKCKPCLKHTGLEPAPGTAPVYWRAGLGEMGTHGLKDAAIQLE